MRLLPFSFQSEGKGRHVMALPFVNFQRPATLLVSSCFVRRRSMKVLREQLYTYGARTLSTAELVALILSTGAHQGDPLAMACRLLATYGLQGLKTADVHELTNEGLSSTKAVLLSAVCELAVRLSLPELGEHIQIRMPADAATLLKPMMAHLDHEEFRVLVLNTKNYVVANILLYQGTLNSSTVRIAEILRHAIIRKCPNLIVAHNHPSLDPEPSPEDYDMTKQLVEAARLLDLELLDHLVIGD